MKPSVYLETSIISYLAARPSRDLIVAAHQKLTLDWWESRRDHYDLYISEAVLDEAARGDPAAAARRHLFVQGLKLLPVTPKNILLAERIVREVELPEKAGVDALHIAVAADHRIQFLATWNCKHIANPTLRPRIQSVCIAAGLRPPEIATPLEMQEI